MLDTIGRREWFDTLIIGDECERAKPDPLPYTVRRPPALPPRPRPSPRAATARQRQVHLRCRDGAAAELET